MGGTTNTTTSQQVSAPTNPDVQATASKLAQGISQQYDKGPSVFNESTFSPAGATTQDAWAKAIGAANNGDYSSSVNGAIKSFGDVAAGKMFGQNDPGYATLRQNAIDDAIKNVGAGFTQSGRFGGGSYVDTATKGAFDAASGLDYANHQADITRQQQAAGILPGLFSASAAPSAAIGAVGSAKDANDQGILSGRYDLSTRQGNAWNDLIARLTSAAAGNAAGTGTTTTNTTTQPQTPWWASLGGAALQAL
jgi:hypothetical protein